MGDRAGTFFPARAGIAAFTLIWMGLAPSAQTRVPAGTASPSVVVHVPAEIDTSIVRIMYSLGAGYGPLRTSGGVHDYPIEATVDGRPAASFKAWGYEPGFGVSVVTVDLTSGPPSRTISLPFQPLATVVMRGRIVGAEPRADQRVEALYNPAFNCDFFLGSNWTDCLTGPLALGSTAIDADGTFAVALPDFARDPALAPFRDKGSFAFRVMDAPGRPAYRLLLGPPMIIGQPGDSRLPLYGNTDLAIADRYDLLLPFYRDPGQGTLGASDRDSRAIVQASSVVVANLASGLPRLPLGAWLTSLVGPPTWEVNDCGEQTGNPTLDAGRDFPMCVTARIAVRDGSAVLVSLVVGTFTKGPVGIPVVWSCELVDARGVARSLKGLADLAAIAPALTGPRPAN